MLSSPLGHRHLSSPTTEPTPFLPADRQAHNSSLSHTLKSLSASPVTRCVVGSSSTPLLVAPLAGALPAGDRCTSLMRRSADVSGSPRGSTDPLNTTVERFTVQLLVYLFSLPLYGPSYSRAAGSAIRTLSSLHTHTLSTQPGRAQLMRESITRTMCPSDSSLNWYGCSRRLASSVGFLPSQRMVSYVIQPSYFEDIAST